MLRLLNYSYIYLIPLLLSAIFSLKSFWLKWPKLYKIFSFFLWCTLVAESFAIAWKWQLFETSWWHYSKSNLWIYNAYLIIKQFFLLIFFSQVIKSKPIKRMIGAGIIVCTAFGIINFVYIQGPHSVNSYFIIVANIITLLLSIAFFRQVLEEKIFTKLSSDPLVLISLGIFIYYSGTLPFFIAFDYLIKEHPSLVDSYLYINDALNIIMYSLFLIAFLCKPHLK